MKSTWVVVVFNRTIEFKVVFVISVLSTKLVVHGSITTRLCGLIMYIIPVKNYRMPFIILSIVFCA